MSKPKNPGLMYRLIRKMNPKVAHRFNQGKPPAKFILLLTTTGRKSGLPRKTPLQFEEIEGKYYVSSGRGNAADWYKNILANPQVEVQIQARRFRGIAEPVTDPERLADFFACRLKRSPFFIGLVMRLEGLPLRYNRSDLKRFSEKKTMVIIRPSSESEE